MTPQLKKTLDLFQSRSDKGLCAFCSRTLDCGTGTYGEIASQQRICPACWESVTDQKFSKLIKSKQEWLKAHPVVFSNIEPDGDCPF